MKAYFILLLMALSLHGICQDTTKHAKKNAPKLTAEQQDSVRLMDSLLQYMDTNTLRNALNKMDSALRDSVYKAYENAYSDSIYVHGDTMSAESDSALMNSFKRAMSAMDSSYRGVSEATLDSLSKVKDDSILNADGKLGMIKFNGLDKLMGLTYEKFDYDRNGDMVRSAYYNNKDEIKPGFAGIAITVCKYDKKHDCIEESFLDEHEKPMNDQVFGVSIIRNKFNDMNQLVESDYFDTDGTPLPGYAKTTYQYDTMGNITVTTNYDAQGNVVR